MALARALCICLALGTTLIQASIEELAAGSDLVVRGTVAKTESSLTKDGSRIVTAVRVDVAETLKGAPARQVTVVTEGGEVGEIGQVVSGAPRFSEKEEVVLFLAREGAVHRVVGMAQGKLEVVRDGAGVRLRRASLGDARLVDKLTHKEVAPPTDELTLEKLRARVRR
jgi:hypothetical protein